MNQDLAAGPAGSVTNSQSSERMTRYVASFS